MKALVLKAPFEFEYEERPMPECLNGEVLVKVDAVCICGSDVGAIKGTHSMFSYPRVIGHEFSGTVVKVGTKVSKLSEGDRVCMMPCVPCNECKACAKGKTNACQNLQIRGVHLDGGLQEFYSAPEHCWIKVDNTLSPLEIAMLEPLTIGAHAAARSKPRAGDQALIIGAGPIGVSCALNLKSYGVEVYLADNNLDRVKFVCENFGLNVFHSVESGYMDQLEKVTMSQMFDIVIDTTASPGSMQDTWKLICNGGTIVFVGIARTSLTIDGQGLHSKETTLLISRNSVRSDYEKVISIIKSGHLIPIKFISHVVSFSDAGDILYKWVNPESKVFKGVVVFK